MTGPVYHSKICFVEKNNKSIEDNFVIYDPDKLPYEKQHICEIIRDLPELTPEEIAKYPDE